MGFETDLKNKGCSKEKFARLFKPIIYGEVKTSPQGFSYVNWTGDLLYVRHSNPGIKTLSFAKQLGKYGIMLDERGAHREWTPYFLDQCTLEEVEQIFYEACIQKKSKDELSCFGKTWRNILQEITYQAVLDDLMSKELNEENENLYLTALEYLVNKAYMQIYIKQLADYYQTKGLIDLAQKYYEMDEKYKNA